MLGSLIICALVHSLRRFVFTFLRINERDAAMSFPEAKLGCQPEHSRFRRDLAFNSIPVDLSVE